MSQSKSGSYIFQERDGKLVFIGDFDGYYRNNADPWGQSATTDMARYYELSRQRTFALVDQCPIQKRILEVGCGHGHVTHLLANHCPESMVTGLDISKLAIEQAKRQHKKNRFEVGDIAAPAILDQLGKASFDVVILNQLLWYILESLPQVLTNIHCLLADKGRLIISNAFARDQRYGTDIVDHFDGAARYFRLNEAFRLLGAQFYDDDEEHDDGHFVLAAKREASAA